MPLWVVRYAVDALYRAESLTEFMDQRLRGDDLRWDRLYWVP